MKRWAFILGLVVVCGASVAAEDAFVPPTEFTAHDLPDDAGGMLCVTWRKSPSESDDWDYVVLASASDDGPFKEVARFPSTSRLRSDLPKIYGFSETGRQYHATLVSVAAVYEPEEMKDLSAESRRLARLLDALNKYERASRKLSRREALDPEKVQTEIDDLNDTRRDLVVKIAAAADEPATLDEYQERLRELTWQYHRLDEKLKAWRHHAGLKRTAEETYSEDVRREIGEVDLFVEMDRLRRRKRALDSKLYHLNKERNRKEIFFRLAVARPGGLGRAPDFPGLEASASAESNTFDGSKTNVAVVVVLFSVISLGYVQIARRRPDLFIRQIAGLNAVEEAIGRATEMGKPVLFVHGLTGVSDVAMIASINILSRIATRVAQYDSGLAVVNNDPIVYALSQEVVREGCVEAGRPDSYRPDDIYMVASRQFPYVAAVAGIMARTKPAANFFMGYFYAEALILAEAGATTGAIQIAGTDAFTQLPFFVTTCDYTLMGEELYAASAYLSREPKLVGPLRGQDVQKTLLGAVVLAGSVTHSLGLTWLVLLFETF